MPVVARLSGDICYFCFHAAGHKDDEYFIGLFRRDRHTGRKRALRIGVKVVLFGQFGVLGCVVVRKTAGEGQRKADGEKQGNQSFHVWSSIPPPGVPGGSCFTAESVEFFGF